MTNDSGATEESSSARRVCMVVHAYYLKDARVRRYAETLKENGFGVDVLCLREDEEPLFECHRGVNIHRINLAHRRGSRWNYAIEYTLSLLFFFVRISTLCLAGNRYQLIHVHNFPNILVLAAAVPKWLGAKVVLDVHDPMPELFRSKFGMDGSSWFLRLLYFEERVAARRADLVLTANHYFEKLLVERSCAKSKTAVILNSPASYFYRQERDARPAPAQGKTFRILYIGTIAARYGLDTLLGAVAKIKKDGSIPHLQLVVIPKIRHEGDYMEHFLREVLRHGLSDSFRLLEPVPNERMPEIIADADVSVYTPRPDAHMDIALSLKIPESIAVGCPVVASRLSVLVRYFGEDSLFMCEPGNAEDCALKILQVYRHPEDVRKRTQEARKRLESFAWEKQAKEYLRKVEVLVGGSGS